MDIVLQLKQILEKINNYNYNVNKLNKIIKIHNYFGDFYDDEKIKNSIETSIHTDYYGWFIKRPNFLTDDYVLENYNNELRTNKKNYLEVYNFNSISDIIKKDYVGNYSKCYREDGFDTIAYTDLILDIIRLDIDSIIKYIEELTQELHILRMEKIGVYNNKLNIVRNRYRALSNLAKNDKIEARKRLLDTYTGAADRITREESIINVLLLQSNDDLNSFYNLFNNICILRNELLNGKETHYSKKNDELRKELIANINKFKLTDEELELLKEVFPIETYTSIELNNNSYKPIELVIKKNN